MGLPAPDMTENGQTAEQTPQTPPPAVEAAAPQAEDTKPAPPAGDTQAPPPADTAAAQEGVPA